MKIEQAWETVRVNIKTQIPEHLYKMWFEGLKLDPASSVDELILSCPNMFSKKRIEDSYAKLIESEFSSLTQEKCDLKFVVQSPNALIIHHPPKIKTEKRLPYWPLTERGAPAAILRSALFGVVKRGRRRHLDNELIASWKGVKIRYTGMRLDQADQDVWLESTHRCRPEPLGNEIYFSVYNFLKALGKKKGKNDYEWLKKAFIRLSACNVEITIDQYIYGGSLIDGYCRDDENKKYVITLNPKIARLFQDDYVRLNWDTRKTLQGDMEKWLHAYVCSQKAKPQKPHRIKLERLMELCGTEDKEIRKFKYKISQAMKKFKLINVVQDSKITDNNVIEFVRF